MYKKPIARLLAPHIPAHNHTPLFRPAGHVHVETIGGGFAQELQDEIESLNCLPPDFLRNLQRRIASESFPVGTHIENLPVAADNTTWQENDTLDITLAITHWMEVLRSVPQEEVTCECPPELRDKFIAGGLTPDEVDRMIIYPHRCSIDAGEIQVVYKLRPKHGVS